MKSVPSKMKGASALASAAFIYSTFSVLIREMAKMFSNNAQVVARFSLAFVITLVIGLVGSKVPRLPKKMRLRSSLLGITFVTELLLFTTSVNITKIANSIFLLYAGSILVSLMVGTIIFHESLTANKWLAVILALIGVAMYSHALLVFNAGVVTGLAAGVFDGLSNGFRKSLKGVNRNALLQYQFGVGSLFALIILLGTGGEIFKTVSWLPIIATIVFAVLQIGLNNLLLYGFEHFDVNVGTVILAMELFFAIIIGYVLYREIPSGSELFGGLLIFSASSISVFDFRLFPKKPPSDT